MRRAGCLTRILLTLLLIALGGGALIALLNPWALHMGGRLTPLLMWRGFGTLRAKGGAEYPIYLYLYPSSHSSRLRLDGLRPTGGLSGQACLCTSPIQLLDLSGTIYGGWRSTDGALIAFRLLEWRTARDRLLGYPDRGYIDLYGAWRGPNLVMDERGSWSHTFHSGLRLTQVSLTLHPDDHWTCNSACAGRGR